MCKDMNKLKYVYITGLLVVISILGSLVLGKCLVAPMGSKLSSKADELQSIIDESLDNQRNATCNLVYEIQNYKVTDVEKDIDVIDSMCKSVAENEVPTMVYSVNKLDDNTISVTIDSRIRNRHSNDIVFFTGTLYVRKEV